jgi:hypothetical protein
MTTGPVVVWLTEGTWRSTVDAAAAAARIAGMRAGRGPQPSRTQKPRPLRPIRR